MTRVLWQTLVAVTVIFGVLGTIAVVLNAVLTLTDPAREDVQSVAAEDARRALLRDYSHTRSERRETQG